ncbi:hypothetical protein GJU40_17805 [Bacillus lacus]|uniref:HEAT repeat domain-containing protein n=1 Tax=Metabacillus lacus TaxID=1983721 RepID=A0A7X2M0D8_9BACI|nr:HEAT repeat domain-containing protein [Metabacillus lacus]MRX73988.1 hypothetical protein [Metabacillus lacus]
MRRFFLKKGKKYNPADQYTQDDIEEILHSVLIDKEAHKLPAAFLLLLSTSEDHKIQAAETLHRFLLSTSMKELLRIDTLFREASSLDWTYNWKNESPHALCPPNITNDQKVSVLGLSTFHLNGYFREKALIELASYETGREIPYMLIRCNDWVPQVRNTAMRLVEERLTVDYAVTFAESLLIIFKLRSLKRVNHEILFEKIVNLLSKKEAVPVLKQAAHSKENHLRYTSYKIMIHAKVLNKSELLTYFQREKEPRSRLLLFNEIINNISEADFLKYYFLLRKDKFPKIRVQVLEMFHSMNPQQSIEELEKALFDKNESVRSVARYLLKKQGITDFAPYYIRAIQQQSEENVRGALLGIGEAGRKEHLPIILPFTQSYKAEIVKAVIRSISLLDAENHQDLFLKMLMHEHIGVSKEARKSLQRTSYYDRIHELYRIYKEGKNSHSRYSAALLLSSLSKWESIRYSIEFSNNKDDHSVSRLGENQLKNWVATYNQSFQNPSQEQVAAIRDALKKYEIAESLKQEIEFCLRGL